MGDESYKFNQKQYESWTDRQNRLKEIEEAKERGEDVTNDVNQLEPFAPYGITEAGVPIEGAADMTDIWRLNPRYIGRDWKHIEPRFPSVGVPETRCGSELIQNPVFKRILGQGYFGTVWLVEADWDSLENKGWDERNKRQVKVWKKRLFAVKEIRHEADSAPHIRVSLNDMRVLSLLRHPNICNYADVIGIPDRQTGFPYAIVCLFFELMDGTFSDIIDAGKPPNWPSNRRVTLPEHLTRHWFAQITNGLQYLHNLGIAHNDFKEDNILFKYRSSPYDTYENRFMSSIFKLSDFGISKREFESTPLFKKGIKSDLDRLFPVLINAAVSGRQREGQLIDTFLRYCRNEFEPLAYPNQWSQLSPHFKDLVLRMAPRPGPIPGFTAIQICQHIWLQMNQDPRTEPFILREPPDQLAQTFISNIFDE